MAAAWYVVQTKPSAEAQAGRHLRRQAYEVWTPQTWTTRRCRGQVIPTMAPVFANYIFVEVDLDNDRWLAINGTRGVKRMLRFGDRPSPIEHREFARLRARIGEEPIQERDLISAMRPLLEVDDLVAVQDGPFESFTGTVLETAGGRAKIMLSLFGRQTETEMDSASLVRIEE